MSKKKHLISVRVDDQQKEELELLGKFTVMTTPDFLRCILSLGIEQFKKNQNELVAKYEQQTIDSRLKELEIKIAKLENTVPNKIRNWLESK
ncbi:hypothetical protein [Vibrio sp. OPT18]|uniref:hypothetical protein n=1 Tax=Vibrio sp. OPT18 TaxID=2778641 RepID=UPI00187DE06C|nr:hypothetical protein [Vibrio sp. OPT18]MBE8574045.1 hypothetical protein [Vibrio sp. OPT18]